MSHQIESLGPFAVSVSKMVRTLSEARLVERLWEKDPSLWKSEPDHQRIIKNSLGWLSVPDVVSDGLPALKTLAGSVHNQGFTDLVLLGMGGSSLVVEVLRQTFGSAPGCPRFRVLDSTDPAAISAIEKQINLSRTLFIVSSKSGTTVEVASFYKYFFDRVRAIQGDRAGEQFMAITDPGTLLERIGADDHFFHVILNPSDIGGRFSALSYFGLAPAALMGLDVEALLSRAQSMARECSAATPGEKNPGLRLGVALAELAKNGRDKLTFIVSPAIASFGLWVEQLIAESTGKEGKGLVPVEGEPLDDPKLYSQDRVFIYLRLGADPAADQDYVIEALENAGQPVIKILVKDKRSLGAEFFRWEFATAVACALLGIDAFDQPNVQESKDNTKQLLAGYCSTGKLPQENPALVEGDLKLYCDPANRSHLASLTEAPRQNSIADYLKAHLAGAAKGDYAALLAYVDPSATNQGLLQRARKQLLNKTGLATTMGFGPRFLHSTGQLHKGGPNTGIFLQITAEDGVDLPIPGQPYTFGLLKQAQALGDYQSLVSKQRRVIRLHSGKDVAAGLERLVGLLR